MNKPKLKKPQIMGSVDEWGTILNINIDYQDIFNQELIEDSSRQDQELARLDRDKISQSEIDTVVKNTVDNYMDISAKPNLDNHVETVNKPELDKYTVTKKSEINTFTEEQKVELNQHEKIKETEITQFVENKKTEINTFTEVQKEELDSYEKEKENQIETFKDEKKVEITTHTDLEIDRINATGIEGKQDKYDGTLQTNSKTIVGAVNENTESIITLGNKTALQGKGTNTRGTIDTGVIIDVVSEDEGILVDQTLKLNIVDDLMTGGVKRPLSAEQGKVLKQLIDAIGSSGTTKSMRQAEVLSEYDYMGSLPANGTSIAVGTRLFDPTVYLNGVRMESNKYLVEFDTGLITLTSPYSDIYDVVWVVEDQMPHHISFCFPTMSLLLASEDVKSKIEIENVIKILGESDADDGGHYLVKCESVAKLNAVDIGGGRFLNEIPNTKLSTIVSQVNKNKSDILSKFNKSGGEISGDIRINKSSPIVFFDDIRSEGGLGGYVGLGSSKDVVQLVNKITNKELRLDSDGKLKHGNNEIIDFSKYQTSFSINGYTKFPNGLIIQKGTSVFNNLSSGAQVENTISFPIAFTGGNDYCVSSEVSIAFSTQNINTNHNSKSASNFQLRCSQNAGSTASSITVSWIAIGY